MREDAKEMWVNAFQKAFGEEINHIDIVYEENTEGSFKWSTEITKNVKEAYGNPDKIKKAIQGFDIVVSGYAPFTKEIINSSNNLKIIGISRGGPVNVDHKAASKNNVYVLKAVGRNAESVADQTMGFILSEMRHIAQHNHEVKIGKYFDIISKEGRSDYLNSFTWFEANGKKLGLIGYGQVGKRVAKRALAFDMSVLVFDPYIDADSLQRDGCTPTDLEVLLKESDFISIHAGLSPETENMINKEAFAKMKRTAVLINTARGGIVDENDLYNALSNREIASAALDVFEEDPIKENNPLIKLDNITITPHTAGRSPESEMRGYIQVAQQIARCVKGEKIETLYISNKEILSR